MCLFGFSKILWKFLTELFSKDPFLCHFKVECDFVKDYINRLPCCVGIRDQISDVDQ